MNRILVIRGGAIGDFILTLPALKLLREAYPHARLEILGYRHMRRLRKIGFMRKQFVRSNTGRSRASSRKTRNCPRNLQIISQVSI